MRMKSSSSSDSWSTNRMPQEFNQSPRNHPAPRHFDASPVSKPGWGQPMPPLPQVSKTFQERDSFGANSVFSGWKSDGKGTGWGETKKTSAVDEPIDTWGNPPRQQADSAQSGGSLFDMSFGATSNGNGSASGFNRGSSIFDMK